MTNFGAKWKGFFLIGSPIGGEVTTHGYLTVRR